MRLIKKIIMLLFLLGLTNCKDKGQGEWIVGTEEERIKKIEKQFRGFDMAMVEIGYRYTELYWAGQDENWEYANYLIEKIQLSLNNGLERRPKRAKSAEMLLNYIPTIQKTVENKNKKEFQSSYQTFTQLCNGCHSLEKVSFFTVKEPLNRTSPIRK